MTISVAPIHSFEPDMHMSAISVVTSIENNDDTDDVFVTIYDITHDINIIEPKNVLSAKVVAKVVATPLPPLNFNHIGNMWPSTASRAHKQWIIMHEGA